MLRLLLFCVPLSLALLAVGCEPDPEPPNVVARLGDQYLTQEEIDQALQGAPEQADTSEIRRQIVEQWVTNALLFQEARRQNLDETPEVQQLLEENERSVLVSALLSQLYEEGPEAPPEAAVRDYYNRHREQLRLREPFVRVLLLSHPNADTLARARDELLRLDRAAVDSLWPSLIARFAEDEAAARGLAANYYAERRLASGQPTLAEALTTLQPGQASDVRAAGDTYRLAYLMDRVPAGTVPELGWIEDEVRERVSIQARKQIYSRQVQRLRTEALARQELEIREGPSQ